MARFTWRWEPATQRYLPAYRLRYGEHVNLAFVIRCHDYRDGEFVATGWFWYCPEDRALGIRWHNTEGRPVPTCQEAQQEAQAYVRQCLEAKGVVKGQGEVADGR